MRDQLVYTVNLPLEGGLESRAVRMMVKRKGDSGRTLSRLTPRSGTGQVRVHGEIQGDGRSAWRSVHAQVRRIPRGRVMTYGQIATLLGSRLSPRAVGWAMHGCPRGVPWQRVVNASGGCSTERMPDIPPGLQRALLQAEGVEFRKNGTLDLSRYRWNPARPPARGRSMPRKGRSLRRTGQKRGSP